MFVAPLIGNFRPGATSPVIDAGRTTGYTGTGVDRDGNPRVVDNPDFGNAGVSVLGQTIDTRHDFVEPIRQVVRRVVACGL